LNDNFEFSNTPLLGDVSSTKEPDDTITSLKNSIDAIEITNEGSE
jgi:hypothetical protein